MLRMTLANADISFACYQPNVTAPGGQQLGTTCATSGIVFTSTQSVVRFVNGSIHKFRNLLRQNRVMLLEGEIDLPIGAPTNRSFDVIEFDWDIVARRIVNDLVVGGSATKTETQRIFKARWKPAND
jgi:hypothetical protein